MSILGSMRAGVSGLSAQSNAFSAISDNIANISTVGYKGTNTAFKTLVTKQTTTSAYSSGGVQSVSTQTISAQGLLSASSSSTDLAISGNGYFVVNQAAHPTANDVWAYTRAGSFSKDTNGYLVNSGGYYAQAWNLLPWDGAPEASVINIHGINYMKAYYDESGKVVYINDNIIDETNLKPINLGTIGGTATQTTQLSMGANLPADDDIGASQKLSALIYDSLGNASNLSIDYNKLGSNHWGMNISIPSGAASLTLNNSATGNSVYAAAGQLEFSSVPTSGSQITIKDALQKKEITFEFVDNITQANTDTHIYVSTKVQSVAEFVENFATALKEVMPSGDRFSIYHNAVKIKQSTVGGALTINASKTQACVQSAANPNEATGVPSGVFTVEEIDRNSKNGATLTFANNLTVNDYKDKEFTIGGRKFQFIDGSQADGDGINNPYYININDAVVNGKVNATELVQNLYTKIASYLPNIECYNASGNTLEITPTTTSIDIDMDLSSLKDVAFGEMRTNDSWGSIFTAGTISNVFTAYGQKELGSCVSAILFNADGTPKKFGVDNLNVEWANGAKDMEYNKGNHIKISMGNVGTSDGFTQLSGTFATSYIKQDGAKFGNYSGVEINELGVVTAIFDNGETRPIAILPVATFSNPNGMTSLTGNVWIASDGSGDPMLRQAGGNGAGAITSYSLEDSTVDLANELSNMVVVQRAYSASTKIITTADEMLDELTRMV